MLSKKIFFFDDKLKIILIFFFFSLVFSSFFSLNTKVSLYHSITYLIFLLFFLVIYSFAKFFKNKIQNYFFLWSFFLAVLIIIDTYYQYLNPSKQDVFGFKAPVANDGRLTSIFKDELIVGSVLYHLFFTSFIYFLFFIQNKNKTNKFFKIMLILFITLFYLVAVFLSGDRMPTIMTLATFFLSIIFLKTLRFKLGIALIIFSLFFVYKIKESNYFFERYKTFINIVVPQEKKSDIINLKKDNFFDSQWGAHYLTGYEIFKNNIYFGIGLKQFKVECSNKVYENIDSNFRHGRCSNHPHNFYVEMISETGIFSTMILILTIFYFFIRCLKVIYNKKISQYNSSFEYIIFISFFVVNVLIFFPFRSSGSFFSNFAGSLVWYNFSFLFIYLKHFENLLRKN